MLSFFLSFSVFINSISTGISAASFERQPTMNASKPPPNNDSKNIDAAVCKAITHCHYPMFQTTPDRMAAFYTSKYGTPTYLHTFDDNGADSSDPLSKLPLSLTDREYIRNIVDGFITSRLHHVTSKITVPTNDDLSVSLPDLVPDLSDNDDISIVESVVSSIVSGNKKILLAVDTKENYIKSNTVNGTFAIHDLHPTLQYLLRNGQWFITATPTKGTAKNDKSSDKKQEATKPTVVKTEFELMKEQN